MDGCKTTHRRISFSTNSQTSDVPPKFGPLSLSVLWFLLENTSYPHEVNEEEKIDKLLFERWMMYCPLDV